MRKKLNKKVIVLLVIAIIVTIIVAVVLIKNNKEDDIVVEEFATTYEDGVKINTSKELAKEKKLDDLQLTDIRLSCRRGLSTLIAKVTNNGTVKTEEQEVKVEVIDKDGNVMMELRGLLLEIEPGASTLLNLNVSSDIAGAYDFRISK